MSSNRFRSVLICVLLSNSICFGQDTTFSNLFKLDIAAPDNPAFTMIDDAPSTILRPSDKKSFNLLVSEFANSNFTLIPNNIGAEISPGVIASKNWKLSEYDKSTFKRTLYNTSLSLATHRDSSTEQQASQLAFGLHFSFTDKDYDPLRSDKLKKAALTHLKTRSQLMDSAQIIIRQKHNITPITLLSDEQKQEVLDSVFAWENSLEINLKSFTEKTWNASRTDVGLGWLGSSPDTLIGKIAISSVGIWISRSLAIEENGQFILGFNTRFYNNHNQDSTLALSISIPARLYYGRNNVKGFMEAQWSYKDFGYKQQEFLFNAGIEARISKIIWLNYYAGIDMKLTNDESSRFVSGIRFNYFIN